MSAKLGKEDGLSLACDLIEQQLARKSAPLHQIETVAAEARMNEAEPVLEAGDNDALDAANTVAL